VAEKYSDSLCSVKRLMHQHGIRRRAYEIAGLRGGDQDVVLAALSKDARSTYDAVIGMQQQHQQ
jgi:hypothetical protein